MQRIVVAVRDRAMDMYLQPFMVPTVGAAVRSFADEINRHDAEAVMSKHPEDYDLYQIALFDENTGIYSDNKPRQIAVGKDMVRHVS